MHYRPPKPPDLVTDSTLLLRMEGTGFLDTSVDKYELPKIHDLSILKPEYRSQGRNDHLYHLSSPQAYAVEKWAAVMRFYHPYIDYAAAGCIPGLEPNTRKQHFLPCRNPFSPLRHEIDD